MKIKVKKKVSKLDKFDQKVDSLINVLIPAIIIMIPVVFILYILNIHGYLFPKTSAGTIFSLERYYRYLMYVLALIYLYKAFFKRVVITKSDIFLFLFMFFTILSTCFAVDKNIALYGYPNRYEGLYTLLFYAFLYLNCKLLKDKKEVSYLLRVMVSVSIVHLIVVLLQLTGIYEKLIFMYTSGDAIGLTENCNFLGSLMCTFSMIGVSGYMLFSKKEYDKYYLLILITSYMTLLFANSTGPFLSFVLTFILLGIYLLIKKKLVIKKGIIVLVILCILYPVCLYKKDTITPDIKSHISYVVDKVVDIFTSEEEVVKEENIEDDIDLETRNLGNGRIRIWSNVFKLVRKRPLLGYGPDNLGLVYEKSSDDNKIADKAHNIYLHIWVSSGVFALISYLLWIGYTLYLALKKDNMLIIVMCFGVIAYSIQGLFNINVLEVTPYFYLLMGFMMLLVNEEKISLKKV